MIRRVAALMVLGIRAPLRSRLVAGLLVLLAVVLTGIKGDGTPEGELRMLLTWTFGIAGGVLGAATLWAGCATVSSDIENGRHVLTAVSPARPFEIWLGRWLGLVAINAMLILVVMVAVFAQLKLKGFSGAETAVFRKLDLDASSLDQEAESIYAYVKSIGAVPEGAEKAEVMKSINNDIRTSYLPVDPGQSRRWVYDLGPGDADKEMKVKFSFMSSYGTAAGCKGGCAVYNESGIEVASKEATENNAGELSFEVPAGSLLGSQRISVVFANTSTSEDGVAVLVLHMESMQVFVPDDRGMVWNILKCGLTLLSLLSLMAALGIACGAMFSFPVATFAATAVVCIAVIGHSDWVDEGLELRHSHGGEVREESAFAKRMDAFSAALSRGVTLVTKPFTDVEALDKLGDGMSLDSGAVMRSMIYTGVVLPLFCGFMAALALRRREL